MGSVGFLKLTGSAEWVKETLNFNQYSGDSISISFHSNDNGNWASGVALDDIQIKATPLWISSSSSGTIQHEEIETFEFSVSTQELSYGEYNANIIVEDVYQSLFDTLEVTLTLNLSLDEDLIPHEFILYNNYPNPFNPSTDIKFSLPNTERVQLIVYDLLGNLVKEMVNEKLSPGEYKYKWSGVNQSGSLVSAGMYLYRIQAGEHRATKKMVLLK